MGENEIIRMEHLRKTYSGAAGEITALEDISFSVREKKIFGIIRLSGAGKSTLVRCVNLLEKPTSGRVIVNGLRDLYHLGAITPQQLTEARVWMSEIVVRIACERATDEDFAALDANIDAAAKAPDFDQRARHNREFHVILARATRNPIMVITMESIMAVFGNFIAQIGPSDNTFILPSRRRFMKHLRARDAAAAAAEMKKALARLQTKYMDQWDARSAA